MCTYIAERRKQKSYRTKIRFLLSSTRYMIRGRGRLQSPIPVPGTMVCSINSIKEMKSGRVTKAKRATTAAVRRYNTVFTYVTMKTNGGNLTGGLEISRCYC